uniref:Paraplegin-like n=1 Tax=Crassostrea virginica TaxID=6565 RepID=A0A8B8EIA4_CRAVI|nr:paraplegin-like [Crassostrea virginica]
MDRKIFAKAKMRNFIFTRFKEEICKQNPHVLQICRSISNTPNFTGAKSSARKQTCLSWSRIMSAKLYLKDKDVHILQYKGKSNFSTTTVQLEKEKKAVDEEKTDEKKSDKDNKEDEEERKKEEMIQEIAAKNSNDPLFILAAAFTLLALAYSQDTSLSEYSYSGRISKNEFDNMMAEGKVRKIVGHPQGVRVYLYDSYAGKGVNVQSGCWVLLTESFSKVVSSIKSLQEEHPDGNQVVIDPGRRPLTAFLPIIILGVAYLIAFRRTVRVIKAVENAKLKKTDPKNVQQGASKSKPETRDENLNSFKFNEIFQNDVDKSKRAAVKFQDIAGMGEAKVEVMEFVDYLKNPMRYQRLGAKIPHGALLLGPPGCGKTLLAKAVAAEAGVPFFYRAGSQFVEIFGGRGASRVRELFKMARAQAPCIIFIDELDAVGRRRSEKDGRNSREEDQTLNQLLVEMDGINTTEGVIMLGATNRVDILDKALLRPGRFDRHILIDLPTAKERVELFEMYLAKIKTSISITELAPRLAQLTPGMSGADIANVCNEAAIYAGTHDKPSVSMADIDFALQKIIGGTEKRSYVRDAREKKINAYYEAGRAVVSWLTRTSDAILKISIVPRNKYRLGHYQYYKPERDLQTNVELFEKMLVHLAGSATEVLVFNHHSTASEKDLDIVKKLAYLQVREFGMSENVGQISFQIGEGDETLPKPYSKYMESLIDKEVRDLVSKANMQARRILEENMDKVHKVAKALMERETLSYEDIERLIGPPPHGSKMPEEYTKIMKPEVSGDPIN